MSADILSTALQGEHHGPWSQDGFVNLRGSRENAEVANIQECMMHQSIIAQASSSCNRMMRSGCPKF